MELGTCFAGQLQSEVKQNQSKREISLDTQLKSALIGQQLVVLEAGVALIMALILKNQCSTLMITLRLFAFVRPTANALKHPRKFACCICDAGEGA